MSCFFKKEVSKNTFTLFFDLPAACFPSRPAWSPDAASRRSGTRAGSKKKKGGKVRRKFFVSFSRRTTKDCDRRVFPGAMREKVWNLLRAEAPARLAFAERAAATTQFERIFHLSPETGVLFLLQETLLPDLVGGLLGQRQASLELSDAALLGVAPLQRGGGFDKEEQRLYDYADDYLSSNAVDCLAS